MTLKGQVFSLHASGCSVWYSASKTLILSRLVCAISAACVGSCRAWAGFGLALVVMAGAACFSVAMAGGSTGLGCGTGGTSPESHTLSVSATAPLGFAMTAPDKAGQRLLSTISVLSLSIEQNTSNS